MDRRRIRRLPNAKAGVLAATLKVPGERPPGTFKETVMMHPDIARELTYQHGRDMIAQATRSRVARQARRDRNQTPEFIVPAIPDTVAELFGDQPQRHATTR
jgi:hypothetical protein